jgi:acyl-CoA reductase-like NAD-dependent aldehyde dehydrogenase
VWPYSEELLARVPATADVDRAVAAARQAFAQGAWPLMSVSERIQVVRRLGEEFEKRQDTLAAIVSDEMGRPSTLSR